jgi:hypothetical protein
LKKGGKTGASSIERIPLLFLHKDEDELLENEKYGTK